MHGVRMHHRGVVPIPAITDAERTFVSRSRRAILVTVADGGAPRPVPVCHVLIGGSIYTPIDEKPKASSDPAALARVRDVTARPDVTVLVDRWSEDWSELAWVRVRGRASVLAPGGEEHATALQALREKYPQYRDHRLEDRPVIVIAITEARSWGRLR